MNKYNYHISLEGLHNLSSYHEFMIMESSFCGCFYCCRIFLSQEIMEWIDNGRTALCPKCGVDAVLPEAGIKLNYTILKDMNERWF